MRALATRPRRLVLAVAMISAATLGTVSASASTSATATAVTAHNPGAPTPHTAPPKGAALAIAYRPTAHAPGDVNTANGRFAACMREQGQKHFPDIHASKDGSGHIRLDVKVTGRGFDPTSDAYKGALNTCAPILKKAGVTFPDPSDLPPLPEPGKGTGKGTGPEAGQSLHIKPGTPGEPDLPSLTTTTTTTSSSSSSSSSSENA
ncbi:hypothetical protein OG762_32040 [Streptomyces sp. NBC_01136]|uniref:hypothetical protein n=1 Tax=Streptomyces sp. NBC_01136 TaxID=2903754 RepID=UPI0038651F78|nr:hypothetical protein OG762_32040 [Streptomyces sp. NBC_01136]